MNCAWASRSKQCQPIAEMCANIDNKDNCKKYAKCGWDGNRCYNKLQKNNTKQNNAGKNCSIYKSKIDCKGSCSWNNTSGKCVNIRQLMQQRTVKPGNITTLDNNPIPATQQTDSNWSTSYFNVTHF